MKPVLLLSLLFASLQGYSQIYFEDFLNQDGYGIQGLCSMHPLSCDTANIPGQTGWTITGDASGLLNADDHFMVINDELLARDTDGELCFRSPWIVTGACDSVDISIRLDETGDLETTDYVDVYVIADGQTTLVPDWLGGGDSTHTLTGDVPDDSDWQTTIVSVDGLQADSLYILVCVRNNSGTETIRLDDVYVSCALDPNPPTVYINELDCDQPGQDTSEFIELAGPPGLALDGLLLVLFNGSDDASYAAISMEGESLNDMGLFTICFGDNSGAYCDLVAGGLIQNGADGVGLFYGRDISEFPANTPLDTVGLIDGLRYSTGEPPDSGLIVLDMDADCIDQCQIDEEPAEYSIQRGSWFVAPPTPGAVNAEPLAVTWGDFSIVYRDGVTNLKWVTESEYHNAYFAIEHARDRQDFAEIGRVDGQHSSRTNRTYRWMHKPGAGVANHYYRIRAVDENGRADYSVIRAIRTVAKPDVNLWPTIARQTFHVAWPPGEPAEFVLYSMTGEIAHSALNSPVGYLDVDASGLARGIYIAKLVLDDDQFTWKVFIHH